MTDYIADTLVPSHTLLYFLHVFRIIACMLVVILAANWLSLAWGRARLGILVADIDENGTINELLKMIARSAVVILLLIAFLYIAGMTLVGITIETLYSPPDAALINEVQVIEFAKGGEEAFDDVGPRPIFNT